MQMLSFHKRSKMKRKIYRYLFNLGEWLCRFRWFEALVELDTKRIKKRAQREIEKGNVLKKKLEEQINRNNDVV